MNNKRNGPGRVGKAEGVFVRHNGELFMEEVPLGRVAERYGTPCYVYSRAAIEAAWHAYDRVLDSQSSLICYSVKANPNIAILSLLASLGSGFDIVSVGELERVLHAGGAADKVVFSGVGKTVAEIERCLEVGIKCFNVESIAELERLESCARKRKTPAPVAIRVNPDVDADTHPYIATGLRESKFGIALDQAREIYKIALDLEYIDVRGIDCHIGSQITQLEPFQEAVSQISSLAHVLRSMGISIQHIDMGGGLGIAYGKEPVPAIESYIKLIRDTLAAAGFGDCELILEPGRSIMGQAGMLITRVEYIKHTPVRSFAIMDAAMNDFMRPAMYDGWHEVHCVYQHDAVEPYRYDLVGAICESGDFLAKDRHLPLIQGDLLAIDHAGAYGFSMSSNYNSRPRCAELMVDGREIHLIRKRESISSLYAAESFLPS